MQKAWLYNKSFATKDSMTMDLVFMLLQLIISSQTLKSPH